MMRRLKDLAPSPLAGEGWGEGVERPRCRITPCFIRATLLACVISLNACTVGPDYVRPEPQMPEQWRTTTTETLADTDLLWWQGFNDPVLNQLITDAVGNNKNIQLARARVDQYLGALQTTRSAYFPQIGAGADASRTRSTEASASPFPSGVANPSGMYAAQFNLTAVPDNFSF